MDDKVLFVGPLERVLHMKTFPAMEGLSSAELVAIAQYAREKFFPSGSLLLRPEEPADAFYLVVQGQVRVQRRGRPSQHIGPRHVVGFLHLLARARTGLEAVAEEDTLTLEFDSDAQLDICEDHFPVLVRYIRYLSGRMIEEGGKAKHGMDRSAELPPVHSSNMDLVERMLVLRHAEPFHGCNPDALGELSRHVTEAVFETGDRVWSLGDPADHFLVVVSGGMTCFLDGGGRFTRGPAATVGMYDALSDRARSYETRAAGRTSALRIDVEPFLDILEDHFDMAMDFVTTIAIRLIELQEENARLEPVESSPPTFAENNSGSTNPP